MTPDASKGMAPVDTVDPFALTPAEEEFHRRLSITIIGQPEAVDLLTFLEDLASSPVRDRKRPIAQFLLAGPSRVGKSHTPKTYAALKHGREDALIRINANDYSDEHRINQLKGAPPAYIGYASAEASQKLAPEALDPYCQISNHNLKRARLGSTSTLNIVVIEEFEKATEEFYKFWMQIFDIGKHTLGNGEVVDFSNTVFFLTSNIGMKDAEYLSRPGMGFIRRAPKAEQTDLAKIVEEAIKAKYPPEFRNRITRTIVYRELTEEAVSRIFDREVNLVQERIVANLPPEFDFDILVAPDAKALLLQEVNGNVAELQRVMDRHLVTAIGRLLKNGLLKGGDRLVVDTDKTTGKLSYRIARAPKRVLSLDIDPNAARSSVSLAFLQRSQRARQKAAYRWMLSARFPVEDLCLQYMAELCHDLKRVYNLEKEALVTHFDQGACLAFDIKVVASESEIDLVKAHYGELSVIKLDNTPILRLPIKP